MSADLFAEFSTKPKDNRLQQSSAFNDPQAASTFSFFDDLSSQAFAPGSQQPSTLTQGFGQSSSLPARTPAVDDADDWGDFEGGPSHADTTPSARHDPFAFVSSQHPQPPQHELTGRPSVQSAFGPPQSSPLHISQKLWTKAPIIKAKKPTDSNVLFDAEDDFDDDDFGDFEDSQPQAISPAPAPESAPSAPMAPAGASSTLVDLLGDLDVSQPARPASKSPCSTLKNVDTKRKATTTKSPVGSFRAASTMQQPKQPLTSKAAPVATPQVADDAWDTFDDWEASIPAPTTTNHEPSKPTPSPTASTPAPILSPAIDDIPSSEQPPTNVPPPGVLLSLFPSFFAEAQEHLFKPMAAQPLTMRNKLLAEPGTIAYLRGYLMLASVAAHIIAGRKLRWKRDQILSQGMRIGPASSRATSGMKLTGIDRGENLKEEREASDVVRAWKDQIGRLRHVTSGVNQIKAGTLSLVPDLQETMPVRTLKQSEGGVPARQPCMLCGLKRDERVTAADMSVEDSFGEWWIEQVNMHRGCRNFWNEHKDRLRQR